MEKIHIYYEIRNGNYKDAGTETTYSKPSKTKTFFMCIRTLFYNTILSRVSVIITTILLCISFSKKNNTPDKIKEIDYKLSSSILSKKEVQHLAREKIELSGFNSEQAFYMFKNNSWAGEEYLDYIFLMDTSKDSEASESVCIYDDLLMFNFSNPSGTNESVHQYRQEGEKLETKMIQLEMTDYYDGFKNSIYVRDGKICENEIEEAQRTYKVNQLKKSINRCENKRILVKSLVAINILSVNAGKNYLKARIKDTEKTAEEYIELCKSYGFEPPYEKDGTFSFVDSYTEVLSKKKKGEEDKKHPLTKEVYKKFENDENELIDKYGVGIWSIPFTRNTLEKMLEKLNDKKLYQ